jgi:AcrR family transcriptional regulator
MNQSTPTSQVLLAAARDLFVERGFDGTSIRAITQLAGANLGAVTYHFGSKQALYEEVAVQLATPFRTGFAETARQPGSPLERLEAIVAFVFEYLAAHPELPRFLMQQLVSSRPLPPALRNTLGANHGDIARLIAEGQRLGSIRAGDARLMALSIIAQPIWLNAVHQFLKQALQIDHADPHTRTELTDTAVRFVRAGLAAKDVHHD